MDLLIFNFKLRDYLLQIVTLFNYFNHMPRLPDCIARDVDSIRIKFIMNKLHKVQKIK